MGDDPEQLGPCALGPSEPDARNRGHGAFGPGRFRLPLGAGGPNEKRPAAGMGDDPEQLGHCALGPSEPDARNRGHGAFGPGRFRLPLGAGGPNEKDLPQDWAQTQNSLGIALWDQASRLPVDSTARKALLTQSIESFRAALEIHTQSVFPIDWVRAQMNLARACALVPDERCAADSFANVLRVYPDWSEGYGEAYVRYHEKLFLFAEAYALNRAWLDRHPDDLAVWCNYIESHLTTGRLAEVSGLLAKVFAKLSPAEQVPLLALEVFALVGQGNPVEVSSRRKDLRKLIAAQPTDFRVNWTFGGTRHFLETDPRFAPHRAQLLALLSALEQPNRAAILAALDACCSNAAQKP